jgi:CBS domain containing-hemolysin-like protein
MIAQAGRLLNQGDGITFQGSRFVVESIDRRRIQQVRMTVERVPS